MNNSPILPAGQPLSGDDEVFLDLYGGLILLFKRLVRRGDMRHAQIILTTLARHAERAGL